MQTAEISALPQILGQPQNQVAAPGEAASFSVVVTDTRALSYQWRFNGTNIVGATGDSLLLQNVGTSNEGEYQVVLTNPSGSVTSAPALLMLDADSDGVPDSWELTFFTNLNQTATSDFDGDGVSNLQELSDHTNPTNRASARYRITVLLDGGSVSKSPDQPSYTHGQIVTLTAQASALDTFRAWTGDISTLGNVVTLVMTNNKTLFAHFGAMQMEWTNRASGDWHSAANWQPNLVPASNDNAIINSVVTVTLSNPAECLDLTLGGSGVSPTLTGSGTLTVFGALTMPGGSMNGSGQLTVFGAFTWTGGTMSGSGRTVIAAGATLEANSVNSVDLTTRTLENGGTVLWTGAGNFNLSSGAIITNRAGALFLVQNANTLGSGSGRFDNAGIFRKSTSAGTTTVASGVIFNNSGTVEIQTGTLNLGGGGAHSGSFEVPDGTALILSGGTHTAAGSSSITGAGQFRVSGGTATLDGLVNVSGSNTFSGGTANLTGHYISTNNTVTISGGTANFSGTGLVTPSVVNLSGATLGGTGLVTVLSQMNWTSGTMSGSGRTVIAAGATLEARPTFSSVNLTTRTLENGGTVLWTDAGGFTMNLSAVITNRAGALFYVQNAATLSCLSGACRLDNAGSFRKSAHTGTTTVGTGLSFNNSGTVEIQTGTLNLGGGGAHSGSFAVPDGTTLILGGGTHTAAGSSSITGAGQFRVGGGTATLDGLVNVSGSNTFSGGIANLTGNYICTNNTVTIAGGTANFSGTGQVSPSVLNLSGTLGGTSTVTVNSVMNWTAGTMSGIGRTIIPPGATLNAGSSTLTLSLSRALENGGNVVWTGAGGITLINGVITNRAGALFHAQNAAIMHLGGGAGRFDNAGIFRKSANSGTTTATGLTFNNSGTVEIQTGTLLLSGSFTNTGAVSLSPGTTNRLTAGGSANGTFTAPATALVEWTAGTFTLNTGAQLNGAGLYKINAGTLTGNADLIVENLDLNNGTLNGTGKVTVNHAMNWTAGTMSGTGRTIIPPGATLNAANSTVASLTTRTLENGGTLLWTGAGNISLNSAVITNRAGALFHVQNAATLSFAGGACRLDNAGTFRKSANTGTTTVGTGVVFNNSGTVEIRSGILAANGGYLSSSNALLNCALGGTTAGTNYGQLKVAGTVTLNGGLSVDLLPGFTPATNDTFTVVTAGSRSGTFANFIYPSNVVIMQISNSPTSAMVRVTDVLTVIPQPMLLPPELSGPDLKLTWTAVSNTLYRVEFNPNLAPSNWNALPGDVIGISNTASKLDPLTPSNRVYRVRALP